MGGKRVRVICFIFESTFIFFCGIHSKTNETTIISSFAIEYISLQPLGRLYFQRFLTSYFCLYSFGVTPIFLFNPRCILVLYHSMNS